MTKLPTEGKGIKENCSICNGTGLVDDGNYDGDTYSRGSFCDTCNGTGKVKSTKQTPKQITVKSRVMSGTMMCKDILGNIWTVPIFGNPTKEEKYKI